MGKSVSGFFGALIGAIVGIMVVGAYIISKDKEKTPAKAQNLNSSDAEQIP
jgi:cytosine/uracil/thiamine/allantoin permease